MDPLTPPSTHLSRQLAILGAGLLVGVVIGVFIAPLFTATSNTASSYQAGFDAAKKLVENSSVGGMIQSPTDVRTLSGTVTAVNGTQFTLHTQSTNPFDDPSLSDRTVLTDSSTVVVKLVPKDPTVFQTEMNAFIKANPVPSSASNSPTPPEPFTRTTVSAATIAAGDTLIVTSAENIKTLKEFSASQIQIQGTVSPSNK
ncbi:MAG: hypothetical protein ACYCZZ_01710 [Minisyncoccota bacterium]